MPLYDAQLCNLRGAFWITISAESSEAAEEAARWRALNYSATSFVRVQPVPGDELTERPESQLSLFGKADEDNSAAV